MSSVQKSLFKIIFYAFVPLCTLNCGGGSEGTGDGGFSIRTLTGSVVDENGQPISNAQLEVLETANSTSTDSLGDFTFDAETSHLPLTLQVTSGPSSGTVDLSDINVDAQTINLNLQLTKSDQLLVLSNLAYWARMGTNCEDYFDNQKVILQKRETPPGIVCDVKFFLNTGVTRLENIAGAVEVRACDSQTWRPRSEGKLGSGPTAGVGVIPTLFNDNLQECEYRIVAPYKTATKPLYIYISTLTLQKYNAGRAG